MQPAASPDSRRKMEKRPTNRNFAHNTFPTRDATIFLGSKAMFRRNTRNPEILNGYQCFGKDKYPKRDLVGGFLFSLTP